MIRKVESKKPTWSRESTAIGYKLFHSTSTGVNFVKTLHSQQVIDAGVSSNLVDDGDAGILGGLFQASHRRSAVACSDHILLVLDAELGNLNDGGRVIKESLENKEIPPTSG